LSNEPVDILLVEDDRRLADLTAEYFRQNGLTVAVEARGDRAVARFKAEQPRGPILIFTARDSDIDQVIGLEAGADDYVAKPVDPMVLLARTRALLRRVEEQAVQQMPVAEIVLGGLRISVASQEVWLDGENIQLTTQEFELLHMLARHAGTILSRDDIFHRLRGIDYDGLDRSIDGRISKLRRKLGDSATAPSRIKTVWGKGYLLVPDAWGELV
jgi:DNA-binding response OmpR family regulator